MRCVAILGRRDEPTDAVEQYCEYLRRALVTEGISLDLGRVRWAEIGWGKALRELRGRTMETGNPAWFLLQYTALGWSRRGFSWRVVRVIRMLKRDGVRCAVVFHDAEAYYGSRLVDRARRAVQLWTMRQVLRQADLAVLTIPAEKIPWIPPDVQNTVFIPVGANLPSPETVWTHTKERRTEPPSVAIFSLSGGSVGAEEVRMIAEGLRYAAERIGALQLVVLGRNSNIGGNELTEKLAGAPVKVTTHGLLAAEQVVSVLGSCDVLLFARGPLSTRRGSALAGIACGLPVVAREGWETAAPVTEAGVVLVPQEAKEGFGPALFRVLSDESYRALLAERSRHAQEQYFSWRAIAAQYVQAFARNQRNH
jgi:glycosyltransferase involved in cell wall biosynthesis